MARNRHDMAVRDSSIRAEGDCCGTDRVVGMNSRQLSWLAYFLHRIVKFIDAARLVVVSNGIGKRPVSALLTSLDSGRTLADSGIFRRHGGNQKASFSHRSRHPFSWPLHKISGDLHRVDRSSCFPAPFGSFSLCTMLSILQESKVINLFIVKRNLACI